MANSTIVGIVTWYIANQMMGGSNWTNQQSVVLQAQCCRLHCTLPGVTKLPTKMATGASAGWWLPVSFYLLCTPANWANAWQSYCNWPHTTQLRPNTPSLILAKLVTCGALLVHSLASPRCIINAHRNRHSETHTDTETQIQTCLRYIHTEKHKYRHSESALPVHSLASNGQPSLYYKYPHTETQTNTQWVTHRHTHVSNTYTQRNTNTDTLEVSYPFTHCSGQ